MGRPSSPTEGLELGDLHVAIAATDLGGQAAAVTSAELAGVLPRAELELGRSRSAAIAAAAT